MMAQGKYYGRQRSYGTLTADIEDFVRETKERMEMVVRASLDDVVKNAQTPVKKGGRMRVDTGFLRASGRASTNGWPSGPSVKPTNALPNSFSYDGEAVTAVLSKLKIGDTFFFGWTANYAEYRELYDGFLEASMQHWARYVAFNTDTLRQRIGK
jgi:hypothetical protein